jgi:hypothetical protein
MATCFGDSKTVNQNFRLGISVTFLFLLIVLTACFALRKAWARWFHVAVYVLGIIGLFNLFTGSIYYVGTAKMKTPYLDKWKDDDETVGKLKLAMDVTKTCRRNVYVIAFLVSLVAVVALLTLTQLKSIPV